MKITTNNETYFNYFYCSSSTNFLPTKKEKSEAINQKAFPLYLKDIEHNRKLSSAIKHSFEHYEAPRILDKKVRLKISK
ncbi:hypothetical protein [Lutibacter oricola]|nr:hypothetical protein [Lutibacter oricola]